MHRLGLIIKRPIPSNLIAITPAGAVSFLSREWGGRVSDKELTMHSGFLKFLQHGDLI